MTRSSAHRRNFLKAAGLTAAGLAVPSVLPGNVWADSPAEKLGVGSIGTGGQGSTIGHGAGRLGNMVACADVDQHRGGGFAGHYGGRCAVYQDYRKLLERDDVDVVTIGTPDHWHTKIAVEAMQAGKDVFCEKPLTLTIAEGQVLCKVARETKAVVQVGTQQRSDCARFLNAVALVRSGRLGAPVTATCSVETGPGGGPFPTAEPPANLDWDFWLGQCPKVPYTPQRCHGNFRWWLEYSGGKATDWGAHHVDIAQWALGKEQTGPVEVEGEGSFPNIPGDFDPVAFFAGRQTIPNGFNTATTYRAVLTFAEGSKIIVQNEGGNGILFEGPKGRIFVNRGRLSGRPVEELTDADRAQLDEETLRLHKDMPFSVDASRIDDSSGMPGTNWWDVINLAHMTNFFECVRARKQPVSDAFTHHRSVSSCHLTNIAMLLKRKLRWDPAKEQFVGDDVANALVARPQREPYAIKG